MLYGRDSELARVAELVDAARASAGGALVVRGGPGAGKSALLAESARLAEDAGDLTVLRTQGIESEAPLAFAALQRLLRPLRPLLAEIPAPQAQALRVAFGEEAGEPGDRFLVFLGALSLVAEAAERQPVLAVVDDAHWLDDASAAALLFIARRLEMERVALLFGARDADVHLFESGDLPELRLAGLDLAAGAALVRQHTAAPVSTEVVAQLLVSTGGNPLALVEVPRTLSADQLAGQAAFPARLPVTGTLERVFLERARRLSPDAQRLLLLVAAGDSTRVATLTAAAAGLGLSPDALGEAERSGLLVTEEGTNGGRVRLQHPLVRSTVYATATTDERREAHGALAAVMTGDEEADRRAWHRAASVDQPSAEVVAELDAAAVRAEQRGGYEAAAAAWERSAELSTAADDRAGRLFGAARGAWLSGQPARARSLVDAALECVADPVLRADVTRLRARIEWNTGSLRLGHRMVLEGARDVAPHDPDRAREMALFAAALASFGGDGGVGIDPAEFAELPDTASGYQRCLAELLLGLTHASRRDWTATSDMLRRAFATEEQVHVDDQDLLPNLGVGAMLLGDVAAIETYHERLLLRARDQGAAVMVLYALTRLAFADIPAGRWGTAGARQAEALRLGEATGQPLLAAMPRAWLLLLAALRGEGEYDEHLAALGDVYETSAHGTLHGLLQDVVRWARGVRASPRSAASFHHLAQITQPATQRLAAIDRIESAVHADQVEIARLWIDDLVAWADATGQSWARALAAHGRALVSDDPGPHFEEALALHATAARPFARARTELAYGEHLRRSRQRVAAREHLRAALDVFEDLRAAPWAERARQELRASGETVRRREETAPVGLTPTELQVAQLVQGGMSNKEVAAQLFVSPRTVDFHLRNVFAKTGVSSRLELAQLTLE